MTLLATCPTGDIDGSTWDPWAQRLLLTTENASRSDVRSHADYPSTVTDLSGALGRGGYEGIQNDSDGNIWIVEDIGGAKKPNAAAHDRRQDPEQLRVPVRAGNTGDLANGTLQVLQVRNAARAAHHPGQPDAAEQPRPARAAHLRRRPSTRGG